MRGGSSGGSVKSNEGAISQAISGSWPPAATVRRCRHEYRPLVHRHAAAPGGVRHHLAQLQPRADPLHPRLPRRFRRREHAGAQRRGHQGQPLRLDRPRPRRRHRAVGPHRRGAGRRPALDHRSLDAHREGRRQPLRPRHLRHEGLRRRLPRQRPRLPARPAQGADALRLLLRRGDRLPRRACAGRAADRQRAAAAGGDRGRAHHDGRGQRAECRRRHRRHLHRRRGAFLDDPSRRQRHPLRRRLHPLAERAAGRAGAAQAHRHRHRARPHHDQCRHRSTAAPRATSWRANAP